MNADRNNKKLDELISKTIGRDKPQFDFDKWKAKHQKEIQTFESQTTGRQIEYFAQPLNIWRTIMKSRMTRLAAAAVIIAGIFLALNLTDWRGPDSVAYGINDVPGLLRDAKTLHVKGSCTYYLKGQKPISCPVEYWMDSDNLRFRTRRVSRYRGREGGFADKYSEHEGVSGTTYRMSIDHTDRTVRYLKSSPFRIRFLMRARKERDMFLRHFYLKTDQLEGFEKAGQEEIDGVTFDIWEKKEDDSRQMITKYWIDPETGELGRYFRRFLYDRYIDEERTKDGNRDPFVLLNENKHEWHEYLITCIERDKTLPDDIFSLEPPNGYTVTTGKEDAPDARVYYLTVASSAPSMTVCFRYTLGEDGSVIVAWSNRSESSLESQAALFEGLEPGDPLPELTFVLHAMHPNFNIYRKINESITYFGRHLAHTKKNDIHYEWSIYIPDSEPPRKSYHNRGVVLYDAMLRRNPDDGQTRMMGLTPDTTINSSEEFDALVLGAMAELSDDGRPPEGITYESVLDLACQIRESL